MGGLGGTIRRCCTFGIRTVTHTAKILTLLTALVACNGSSNENKECEKEEDCRRVQDISTYCDDGQCVTELDGYASEYHSPWGDRVKFFGLTDSSGYMEFEVGGSRKQVFVVDGNENPIKHVRVDIIERMYSLGLYAYHPDFTPRLKIVDKISPARTSHDQYKISLTPAPWEVDLYPNDDASLNAFNNFSTLVENPDSYVRCVSNDEMVLRYDIGAGMVKFLLSHGGDLGAVISKSYSTTENVVDILQENGYVEDPFDTFCAYGQQYTHIDPQVATTSITLFVCAPRQEEIRGNHVDDDCDGTIDEDCRRITDERVCVGNSIWYLNVCDVPGEFLADCTEGQYCEDGHCECYPDQRRQCYYGNSIVSFNSCGNLEGIVEYCEENEHCVQTSEFSSAYCAPGPAEEPDCDWIGRECRFGDAYAVNSCGDTTLIENCSSTEECISGYCIPVSEPECEPTTNRTCAEGNVYTVDSCGIIDEFIERCDYPEEECLEDRCVSRCEPHYSEECYVGSVFWVNSCGEREDLSEACSTSEECIDAVCVEGMIRGKIAFVSLRDGNSNIYTMNSDGTDQTRITSHDSYDSWPAWSPDGTRIAFVSERTEDQEIYTMDPTGDYLNRITDHQSLASSPAWSPSGEQIAFTSYKDENAEIYIIRDGSIGEYETGTNITNNSSYDDHPTWSPSGTELAFTSERDENQEIYIMNSDGTNVRRITDHLGTDAIPKWSPDGSHILYTSQIDGQLDIVKWNRGTGVITRLTTGSADDYAAVWSPDGTRIAFTSDRSGGTEVYIMNADGTEQMNITNSPGFDGLPTWTE